MLPVVALVGRPNVGKSTLFNQLTRSRDALVADEPGLTRDRKYGRAVLDERAYLVIDTGGLSGSQAHLDEEMARQTRLAIDEADVVVFLVDARAGLTPADEEIAMLLRRQGKPVVLAVNKTDGRPAETACAEFYQLGFAATCAIAAAHGHGTRGLLEVVAQHWPPQAEIVEAAEAGVKIAVVGRPNVGKSTLINRFVGEERLLALDMPGTTRDSIAVPMERDGVVCTLIDTAGIRRRSRVRETVEKFSVVKALQAIEAAHVVIAVLDAQAGVADQDASLLGYVAEQGRALVLAVNKWDGLGAERRQRVRAELDYRLPFLDFVEIHYISALHGSGIGDLFAAVLRAYDNAQRELDTPELTRLLETAVQAHAPPLVRGRRIKLRYAHQGGRNPPVIVIHGNQTERVPKAYERYLVNHFRRALQLRGTPIRLEFKSGANPYAGKKNPLSRRQQLRKKRLLRHVKKRRARK